MTVERSCDKSNPDLSENGKTKENMQELKQYKEQSFSVCNSNSHLHTSPGQHMPLKKSCSLASSCPVSLRAVESFPQLDVPFFSVPPFASLFEPAFSPGRVSCPCQFVLKKET